jgi:hypothetical protein
MLSKAEKKKFLAVALTCLRQPGEDRPIFSKDIPSDQELQDIKKGLLDGDIDEALLEKFFPMAYAGAVRDGVLRYYFVTHNREIRKLARYSDSGLIPWCTAYPGEIIGEEAGKTMVRLVDGRELLTDAECYPGITATRAEKGDRVLVHRGKIHLVLTGDEYAAALRLFEEGNQATE